MKTDVEDLIGKVVNYLTVVDRAPDRFAPSGKKRIYWSCQCTCGNICEVRSDALRSEKTKSCGCLIAEAAKKPRDRSNYKKRQLSSLLGNKYGLLKVVSRAEDTVTPKGRKLPRWNCLCGCGSNFNVLHEELRKGTHVSCGCVSKKYYDIGCTTANEEFILKASAVHGTKYDYSSIDYRHSQEYIDITCYRHGIFKQKPSNHLNGTGCPDCAISDRSHDRESFITRSYEIHGNTYNYDLVDFSSSKESIDIICKIHGTFQQKPCDHLSGRGCQICGNLRKFVGLEDFVERSKAAHGNKFDYSKVVYEHSAKKVEIVCQSHGSFFQKPAAHMQGHQCPKCSGEERALRQHWNYTKRCELNPDLAKSEGTLYLLKMSREDEEFLKVGISSNFKRRLGHYKEDALFVEVLKEIKSTALQTAYWERDILRNIRDANIRYIPIKSFKGWTECALIDGKNFLIELFDRIETFERC